MAKVRLTPKQRDMLYGVAVGWGKVFTASYPYHFLIEKGLVRDATREEVQTHYQGLANELEGLRERIKALLPSRSERDWKQVVEMAKEAEYLSRSIRNREEDEEYGFVVLTDAALQLVADRLSERKEVAK